MSKIKIDNIKACIDDHGSTYYYEGCYMERENAVIELRELVRLANIGRRLLNSIDKNYYWVMSESNDSLNTVGKNDFTRLMNWEYEDE